MRVWNFSIPSFIYITINQQLKCCTTNIEEIAVLMFSEAIAGFIAFFKDISGGVTEQIEVKHGKEMTSEHPQTAATGIPDALRATTYGSLPVKV